MPHRHSKPISADPHTGGESQTTATMLGLRELLLRGEFQPGERMAEIPLAARLGVSRTPLRMALMALEQEGLLSTHPTRGFVVREFSLRDIRDAIEIRGVLEGTAARFAAERMKEGRDSAQPILLALDDCLKRLDAVVSRLSKKTSFDDYIALNRQFHRMLLALAQSELLSREMERVISLPFASPNAFLRVQAEIRESRHILLIAQDQHRALVDAIEAGEGARAEALAREHARLAQRNLEVALRYPALHHLMPGISLVRDHRLKKTAD